MKIPLVGGFNLAVGPAQVRRTGVGAAPVLGAHHRLRRPAGEVSLWIKAAFFTAGFYSRLSGASKVAAYFFGGLEEIFV